MNNEDEEGRVRCKSTMKNKDEDRVVRGEGREEWKTRRTRRICEKRISQQDDDAHTPSSTEGAGEDRARDDAQSVQQLV